MKFLKSGLLLLLLMTPALFGQSAQRSNTAIMTNNAGYVSIIPNASVYVCQYNSELNCTTPVAVYSDPALTSPISQPVIANAAGVYNFYITNGTQVVEKVCAPYDQCYSVGLTIGTYGAGSPGVTSINSVLGSFTFTGSGVNCSGTTCTFSGGSGSGTVQPGNQYSPAFYNQTGSTATVGGTTPFTGLEWFPGSAPPQAATLANLQTVAGFTFCNPTSASQYNLLFYNSSSIPCSPATISTDSTGSDLIVPKAITTQSIVNIYPVTSYAQMTAAETALSSTGGIIEVTANIAITSTHQTPANIAYRVERGGGFTVSSGQYLQIQGDLQAGLYQIFFGSGPVFFYGGNGPAKIYPQWFGATGNAQAGGFTSTASSTTVVGLGHIPWSIGEAVTMVGAGPSGGNLTTTITGITGGSYPYTGFTVAAAPSTSITSYMYNVDDSAALEKWTRSVSAGWTADQQHGYVEQANYGPSVLYVPKGQYNACSAPVPFYGGQVVEFESANVPTSTYLIQCNPNIPAATLSADSWLPDSNILPISTTPLNQQGNGNATFKYPGFYNSYSTNTPDIPALQILNGSNIQSDLKIDHLVCENISGTCIGIGFVTTTSGTVNSGSTTIPVVAGATLTNGMQINIAGAGVAGATYTGTISSGGRTNSLVVTPATSTTVTNAKVMPVTDGYGLIVTNPEVDVATWYFVEAQGNASGSVTVSGGEIFGVYQGAINFHSNGPMSLLWNSTNCYGCGDFSGSSNAPAIYDKDFSLSNKAIVSVNDSTFQALNPWAVNGFDITGGIDGEYLASLTVKNDQFFKIDDYSFTGKGIQTTENSYIDFEGNTFQTPCMSSINGTSNCTAGTNLSTASMIDICCNALTLIHATVKNNSFIDNKPGAVELAYGIKLEFQANNGTFCPNPAVGSFTSSHLNGCYYGVDGNIDFNSANWLELPAVSGFTSSVNGMVGFDSTNGNYHAYNGADSIIAVIPVSSAVTSGDCTNWSKTGNLIHLGDTGSPCGSGGSGDTITSPNSTLAIGGTSSATTLDVANAVTFNNSGTGAASGTTYNGSTARTISYNTLGASPTVGSTSLTTLGTVTTGTWNGTAIGTQYGGTGQNWSSSNGIPELAGGTFSLFNTTCSSASNALTWNSTTHAIGCNSITVSNVPLSSITAATGSNTLSNANNGSQVWNWALTSNSETAFTFGETSAATGTSDELLAITTIAGSTAVPITITNSLTGSQTLPALQVLPTWNTTGVVDAAILVNAINTASGTGSKLLDLQVGGTSQASVDKSGNLALLGSISTGSSAPSCGSATGCIAMTEASTAGTPASGVDYIRASSTTHQFLVSLNNGAELISAMNYAIGTSGGTVPLLNTANTWSALQTFGLNASLGTTAHGVLISENTSAIAVTAAGSSGQPLLSGGSSADPAYGTLGIGAGGTGATTAANALINLFPTATRVGDVIYCATYSGTCTSWALLAGNNSGTNFLEENSSGVPSWGAGGGGDSITSPNGTITVGGTSSATTLDVAGAAGKILAGATPALTATPALGTDNSTAGTLQLSNGSANAHTILGSAATTSNTVDFFATVPANLDLVYCAVSSTTCTLTDAGYAYNTVVTSSATVISNQAVNGLGSRVSGTGFSDTAGTITNGDLACYTASNTVGNCASASANNILGVFNTSTTWIASGEVSVNLDSTVSVTFGDILCVSTTTAGTAHDNGSVSCNPQERVGIVKTTASSVTSATAFIELE